MVLALAALAAAAASFPTGFGFGAGYGAGVRVGYDIIYPKLAPFAAKITDDLLKSMGSLWGDGGPPPFDPTEPDVSTGPDITKPAKTVSPTGRSREIADGCMRIKERARQLQKNVADNFRLKQIKTKQLTGSPRADQRKKFEISNIDRTMKQNTDLLNALLNNPNNRTCVEGMKF